MEIPRRKNQVGWLHVSTIAPPASRILGLKVTALGHRGSGDNASISPGATGDTKLPAACAHVAYCSLAADRLDNDQ
eukprot:6150736-Prymnesium_polylepis.2